MLSLFIKICLNGLFPGLNVLAQTDRYQADVKGHTRLWMNVLSFYCHLHNRLDWLKRIPIQSRKALFQYLVSQRGKKIRIRRAVCSSLFRGLSTEGCVLSQQLYLLCIVKLFIFETVQDQSQTCIIKKTCIVCALSS